MPSSFAAAKFGNAISRRLQLSLEWFLATHLTDPLLLTWSRCKKDCPLVSLDTTVCIGFHALQNKLAKASEDTEEQLELTCTLVLFSEALLCSSPCQLQIFTSCSGTSLAWIMPRSGMNSLYVECSPFCVGRPHFILMLKIQDANSEFPSALDFSECDLLQLRSVLEDGVQADWDLVVPLQNIFANLYLVQNILHLLNRDSLSFVSCFSAKRKDQMWGITATQ